MTDSDNTSESRGLWLWAIFSTALMFVLEFVMFAAFIPTNWSNEVTRYEADSLYAWHTQETAQAIIARGRGWYETVFLDSGLVPWSYDLLAPAAIPPGQGFERMADIPLWGWLRGRLDVIWSSFAQAMQRLALLAAWWPFFALTLLGALIDGLVRRRIRAYGFRHSSPLVHRIGMSGLWIMSIGVLVLLLAPVPVPAIGVPVLALITAVLLGLSVSQTQARI